MFNRFQSTSLSQTMGRMRRRYNSKSSGGSAAPRTPYTPAGMPPVADAGADQTVDFDSNTNSVLVNFDGSNSYDPDDGMNPGDGIVSYAWSFGDGSTGSGATPSHTYTAPGTYTVELTVRDNENETDTDTMTVAVKAPPVADAGDDQTVEFDSMTNSVRVNFDGSNSYDPDDGTNPGDGIDSYAWRFGDGSTGSGATPSHTYTAPGTYTVELTVRDNENETDTDTMTVAAKTPPVADAGADQTVDFDSNTNSVLVNFDGSNSYDPDGGPLTYEWSFGDGSTGTGATPSHTFTAPGTYTVELTVTDNENKTDSDMMTVTVSDPPSLTLTGPDTVARGDTTTYSASIIPADLTLDATPTFNWKYTTTVRGDRNTVRITESIDATSQNPQSATWSGTMVSGGTLEVRTTVNGTEYVQTLNVTVTDRAWDTDVPITTDTTSWGAEAPGQHSDLGDVEYDMPFTAADDLDAAAVSSGPNKGILYIVSLNLTAPFTVKINRHFGMADADLPPCWVAFKEANTRYGEIEAKVKARLGFDGTTSGTLYGSWEDEIHFSDLKANLEDFMEVPGGLLSDYEGQIALYLSGISGNRIASMDRHESGWSPSGITINYNYLAADAGEDQTVDVNTDVTFDGSASCVSSGRTIASYSWDFGPDATPATGTGVSPSCTYSTHGEKTVTLTVTDSGGDTDSDTMVVTVKAPPVADAGDDQTVDFDSNTNSVLVNFDGSNSYDPDNGTNPGDGIVSYAWSFGDGSTGTGATPSHTYTAPGTYTVTLTVKDDEGDKASDSMTVTVVSLTLTGSDTVTRGDMATYTASITPEGLTLNDTLTFNWTYTTTVRDGRDAVSITESIDATAQTTTWSGAMVSSGTLEVRTTVNGTELAQTMDVTVNNRTWGTDVSITTDTTSLDTEEPRQHSDLGDVEYDIQYTPADDLETAKVSSGPNKEIWYIASINLTAPLVVKINKHFGMAEAALPACWVAFKKANTRYSEIEGKVKTRLGFDGTTSGTLYGCWVSEIEDNDPEANLEKFMEEPNRLLFDYENQIADRVEALRTSRNTAMDDHKSGWSPSGITINYGYFVADAGEDQTVAEVDTDVTFEGSASCVPAGRTINEKTGYSWEFGSDATPTTGSGVSPSCTYSTPGEKIVTLTVTDSGGTTARDTMTVRVLPLLTLTGPDTVTRGDTATYTASITTEEPTLDAFTFKWEYTPIVREGQNPDPIEECIKAPEQDPDDPQNPQTTTWSGKMVSRGTLKVSMTVDDWDLIQTMDVTVNKRPWVTDVPICKDTTSLGVEAPRTHTDLGNVEYDICFSPANDLKTAKVDSGPNNGIWYITSVKLKAPLVAKINRHFRMADTDSPKSWEAFKNANTRYSEIKGKVEARLGADGMTSRTLYGSWKIELGYNDPEADLEEFVALPLPSKRLTYYDTENQIKYETQIVERVKLLRAERKSGMDTRISGWSLSGITVNYDYFAARAGSDQTVDVNTEVTFDGSASFTLTGRTINDPSGYSWNFGSDADPATSVGKKPRCTYSTTGAKTVTLTVTDSAGGTSCDTMIVTVKEPLKRHPGIPVGMMGIQYRTSSELRRNFHTIYEGDSNFSHPACNHLHSYGYDFDTTNAWGLNAHRDGTKSRAQRHAIAWANYVKAVSFANNGLGGPKLKCLISKPLTDLSRHKPTNWNSDEFEAFVRQTIHMIDEGITPTRRNPNPKDIVAGWYLADDALDPRDEYSADEILAVVEAVHCAQKACGVNWPFYFADNVDANAFWDPVGKKVVIPNLLKEWVEGFPDDATPIFMPYYYPWLSNNWDYTVNPPWKKWKLYIEKLHGEFFPSNAEAIHDNLKFHPILDASQKIKQMDSVVEDDDGNPVLDPDGNEQTVIENVSAGLPLPGHADMHKQIRVVWNLLQEYDFVTGIWFLGWNIEVEPNHNPDSRGIAHDNWKRNRKWAEAIQNEPHETEGILEAIPASNSILKNFPDPLAVPTAADIAAGNRTITRIPYHLAERCSFTIEIRLPRNPDTPDVEGDLIRTINEGYTGESPQGQFANSNGTGIGEPVSMDLNGTTAHWDGNNQDDDSADDGTYEAFLVVNDTTYGPITITKGNDDEDTSE